MSVALFSDSVRTRIRECLDIAEKYFNRTFSMPDIDMTLRGTCAGQYMRRGDRHFIRVNRVLALENLANYMRETIPHEVAHYVTRSVYGHTYRGKRVTAHGPEWKSVMVRVYGLPPTRCHQYDTSNARTRTVGKSYKYACNCKEWNLTIIRHRRVLKGQKYTCTQCHGVLQYQGKV